MPVLGQYTMREDPGETVDDRDHGISFRDRQRTAGAEIVLNIDDDQAVIGVHDGTRIVPYAMTEKLLVELIFRFREKNSSPIDRSIRCR